MAWPGNEEEEDEVIQVNAEEARRMVEEAATRQDDLDRQALLEEIHREAEVDMNHQQIEVQARQPLGEGPRFRIPRHQTASSTPVPAVRPGGSSTPDTARRPVGSATSATSEKVPKRKRKKKMKTSDSFPEDEWPTGYTREQINSCERSEILAILDRQQRERTLAGKETPLPGKKFFPLKKWKIRN